MLKLALYKNLDTKQPISFTGRTETSILKKLRKWMDDNNGEWCPRRGQRPCQVDGLTFVDYLDEEEQYVSLVWDECYKNWEIVVGFEPGDDCCEAYAYDAWTDALDLYLSLVEKAAYWEA